MLQKNTRISQVYRLLRQPLFTLRPLLQPQVTTVTAHFTHIPIGWLNVRVHGDWLFCSSFRFDWISLRKKQRASYSLFLLRLCLCVCFYLSVQEDKFLFSQFLGNHRQRMAHHIFKFLSHIQNITFKTKTENQYGRFILVIQFHSYHKLKKQRSFLCTVLSNKPCRADLLLKSEDFAYHISTCKGLIKESIFDHKMTQ